MRGSAAAPWGGCSESRVQSQLRATSSFSTKPTSQRGVPAGNQETVRAPLPPPAAGTAGHSCTVCFLHAAGLRRGRAPRERPSLASPTMSPRSSRRKPVLNVCTLVFQGAERSFCLTFRRGRPELSSAPLSEARRALASLALTAPPPSPPPPPTSAHLPRAGRLRCACHTRVWSWSTLTR